MFLSHTDVSLPFSLPSPFSKNKFKKHFSFKKKESSNNLVSYWKKERRKPKLGLYVELGGEGMVGIVTY